MYSIIAPIDTNRLEQFAHTKRVYDSFPEQKEFLMPTRSFEDVSKFLHENDLMKDVRLFPYTHERGFNPSMALNIGLRESKYDNVIVTSPEVKPLTHVLEQFNNYIGENVLALVFDQDLDGNQTVLVSEVYRSDSPAMYFLAKFNKSDLESINGWDEDFMLGYAYEDNDFGERWKRAGLTHRVADEIQAIHQYHPRAETIPGGISTNEAKFKWNNEHGVIKPVNGMTKL